MHQQSSFVNITPGPTHRALQTQSTELLHLLPGCFPIDYIKAYYTSCLQISKPAADLYAPVSRNLFFFKHKTTIIKEFQFPLLINHYSTKKVSAEDTFINSPLATLKLINEIYMIESSDGGLWYRGVTQTNQEWVSTCTGLPARPRGTHFSS